MHAPLRHFLPKLVAMAILTIGCQGKSERAMVSGKVTFEGKPVEFGDIVFQPVKAPADGAFAQGKIVNGEYRFDLEHGPVVGPNVVQIYGYKMTGRQVIDIAGKSLSEAPKTIAELVPYIPTKFNEASELTVDVPVGMSDNLDFNL
jgi:hypothetical protein